VVLPARVEWSDWPLEALSEQSPERELGPPQYPARELLLERVQEPVMEQPEQQPAG
jgi:hypothetical protein